jgi:stress response protein SCP2
MALSLKKGEGISLRKEENDLSQITMGLGWDMADPAAKKRVFYRVVCRKACGI